MLLLKLKWKAFDRYPDEEAGQVPIAFVVKRIGSFINESQIMDLIAKQVINLFMLFSYTIG